MKAPPKPTEAKQRLDSLDVLRGFAVLAIFAVNVKMMANGYNHYGDIAAWEGAGSEVIGNLLLWFVHGKFVTIFTALFGAGPVPLLDRENPIPLPIVLRRLFWLMVLAACISFFCARGIFSSGARSQGFPLSSSQG